MSRPMNYETLIKVAAGCFNPGADYEVQAQHGLVDEFDVSLPARDGSPVTFRVTHGKGRLELILPLATFTRSEYDKWERDLEYELEQVFMRNVRLEKVQSPQEYKIKVDI